MKLTPIKLRILLNRLGQELTNNAPSATDHEVMVDEADGDADYATAVHEELEGPTLALAKAWVDFAAVFQCPATIRDLETILFLKEDPDAATEE